MGSLWPGCRRSVTLSLGQSLKRTVTICIRDIGLVNVVSAWGRRTGGAMMVVTTLLLILAMEVEKPLGTTIAAFISRIRLPGPLKYDRN